MIDDSLYGKKVKKLASSWDSSSVYSESEIAEYKRKYLEDREEAYQKIALGYIRIGHAPPARTVLSGE